MDLLRRICNHAIYHQFSICATTVVSSDSFWFSSNFYFFLAQEIEKSSETTFYRVKAIICHKGAGLGSGHFVNFTHIKFTHIKFWKKLFFNQQWQLGPSRWPRRTTDVVDGERSFGSISQEQFICLRCTFDAPWKCVRRLRARRESSTKWKRFTLLCLREAHGPPQKWLTRVRWTEQVQVAARETLRRLSTGSMSEGDKKSYWFASHCLNACSSSRFSKLDEAQNP